MIVYSWDQLLQHGIDAEQGSALTIGGFDGPHRGHMVLFNAVLAQKKYKKGIITFTNSPRSVKEAQSFNGYISTLRLRLDVFERLGFDFAVVIDFSREFGRMKGTDFLRCLLDYARMSYVTVGRGFRCGYEQDVGEREIADFSASNGIAFFLAPAFCAETGERVSSTLIRRELVAGNLVSAAKLLGFDYRLDISGVNWGRLSDRYICERSTITQIIPPVGHYTVQIETNATVIPNVKLYVEEQRLCCSVPSTVSINGMQTLVFGYPQD